MSSTASGREIYVVGKDVAGNRDDFPASAKYTYASGLTKFPYSA